MSVTAISPSVIGQGANGVRMTVTGTGFDPTSDSPFNKAGFTKVSAAP